MGRHRQRGREHQPVGGQNPRGSAQAVRRDARQLAAGYEGAEERKRDQVPAEHEEQLDPGVEVEPDVVQHVGAQAAGHRQEPVGVIGDHHERSAPAQSVEAARARARLVGIHSAKVFGAAPETGRTAGSSLTRSNSAVSPYAAVPIGPER